MSFSDDRDPKILPFTRAGVSSNGKEVEDWLSPLGQEAVFLARPSAEHRAKRGISGTDLSEYHVMDKEGTARLLRIVHNFFGPEEVKWVSPTDFCREMEKFEIKDQGK